MRGDNRGYQSYPVKLANSDSNGFDYPLAEQDEQWITKKKVETVTKKNLERHLQRQVVLEDGRVILEDDPEITNDLTEDRQTHEDAGTDDIKMSSFDRALWGGGRGGTVLGEKFQRNINTHDVKSKSVTTAAANNLGEIRHHDVDKVVNHSIDIRNAVRPFANNKNALTIPARVTHRNSSHNRTVDKEDVHEVDRMHEGRLKTDRYVTREVVRDTHDDTPDDGTSTDSESYDGDAHGYTNQKEERYIDYYKVRKGRPVSEGEHLRRGIHMRSQEKDGGRVDPWSKRARNTALTYHDHSDSTSDKPPRPYERKGRKASKNGRRFPSSERSFPSSSKRSNHDLTTNRFHTIERSEKIGRRKKSATGYRKYHDGKHSDSDRSYRSRSISRSSAEQDYGHRGYKNGNMRSDLDSERESRLRRAFSFSSKSSQGNKANSSNQDNKSFLGSVKSLYATIKKKADGMFENQKGGPSRPPRRHRSAANTASVNGSRSGHSDYTNNRNVYSENGRAWSGYSGSLQRPTREMKFNSRTSGTNQSSFVDPDRVEKRGRKVTRRKTMTAFDEAMKENRDPPKFEGGRDRERGSYSGRFFGQDSEVVERERVAPDMRRHLLNNVNLSRMKSMSTKDLDSRPPIRVI